MSAENWLGWKEVLAEVLSDFPVQENVAPEWLVNPETGRRLKLDLYYPDLHLAVRFQGARPRAQRRRLSDEERDAGLHREDVRRQLCQRHGIVLVSIDVREKDPRRSLDRLHAALSRVTRQTAKAEMPTKEKVALIDRLAEARHRLGEVRERLRRPEVLATLADKWRDRETRIARQLRQSSTPPPASPATHYEVGMRVVHERFGPGQVVAVKEEANGDQQVTVDFPSEGQRTFLASLVARRMKRA